MKERGHPAPAAVKVAKPAGTSMSSGRLPPSFAVRPQGHDECGTDDAGLLDLVANGDLQAFWTIWGRYHQDLFWTYHRLCKGNRQDIHDALSGLCIRLSEDLPSSARSIVHCRTWLRRVAVNHFIDTHRARRRHAVPIGSFAEIATLANDQGLASPDPEQANADRLLLGKVLTLLDRVPDPRQRRAARMRFLEEHSYRDIAAAMQVSEELVRKWIQQVRQHLQRGVDGRPARRSARATPAKPAKPPAAPRRRRAEALPLGTAV